MKVGAAPAVSKWEITSNESGVQKLMTTGPYNRILQKGVVCSMSEDNMREVYKNFTASQDKFIYFLLAATIAAIGFTVTKTHGLKLSITQIPVAISILCWGLSIWFGLRNRQYLNSTLFANFDP